MQKFSPFPTAAQSPWHDAPSQLQAPLQGDLKTEVAVIGAGFTGMYTALGLKAAGVDVTLIEKSFAGAEASGRNSGYVDGLIGKDYPSLLRLYKLDRAKRLCEFSANAVRKLEDFIQKHNIDCDYVPNGNINAAVHPKQEKKLQKLAEAGRSLGTDFEFLSKKDLEARGIPDTFISGVLDPVGGVLNPGKLVDAIRQLVIDSGIRLFEQTTVQKIGNTAPVEIYCDQGKITADQVVLATNAFTSQLGWKKRFMSPVWAGMFETEPLNEEQRARLNWPGREGIYTAHQKLESYRRTEHNTLIAGGKYVKIPFGTKLGNISVPKMSVALQKVFRQRFPQFHDLKLATFWGGWISIPLDFMPGLGVAGKHKNIHYGIGYAGHGVPQTLMVGDLLAHQVLERPHPYADVLQRKTLPIPPEPFKWLASKIVDTGLGWMDAGVDRQLRKGK